MAIGIGSNIASLGAQRRLAEATSSLASSYERLASGQRINRAADDAASLAIAAQLDAKTRIYSRAVLNINDGISLLSIGEKALQELKNISLRQRELATQAANETYSTSQRGALNREAEELTREYQRIVESTTFNNLPVFNTGSAVAIQAGSGTQNILAIDPISFGAAGSSTITVPLTTITEQDGSFGAVSTFSLYGGGDNASSDVNGDGKKDLINATATGVVVYLGDGGASFSPSATLATPAAAASVEACDIDGDGDSDISATLSTGFNYVWLNQGSGTFASPTSYDMSGGNKAVLSEINGDSYLDLVGFSTNWEGISSITAHFGTGPGTFNSAISWSPGATEGFVMDMALGDIDGDGDNDLVFLNDEDSLYYVPSNIGIFTNDGNGAFSPSSWITFGSAIVGSVALSDLNGDSELDLAYSVSTGIQIKLGVAGAGNASFQPATNIAMGQFVSEFALGDVDDNGDTDLVATGQTQHRIVLNEDGSFALGNSYAIGGLEGDILLEDFNNDGFLDILGSNGSTFRFQAGQGSLVEVTTTITVQTGGGAANPLDLTTVDGAKSAMDELDDRLINLSSKLDSVGAITSRLTAGLNALAAAHDSYLGASARIKSADIAEEAAGMLRLQLLQNIGAAILAQANQQPQSALKLLV